MAIWIAPILPDSDAGPVGIVFVDFEDDRAIFVDVTPLKRISDVQDGYDDKIILNKFAMIVYEYRLELKSL